ncbi:TIGR02646 family protein [Streptomyces sp. Ncost-T6T-1]|uniref:HNH endonuclease n=1 Tax=Streptomyces sp. Ncost-T6T-1 TaxID=1100828 RepID=UPI000805949E|nr:HNH endonuclease [Streptomyces sp. Ncost-T6T-1]SBU90381.1 TIGR02646 family protein [Streptomyces sp. Ncost-T6T-1]
MSGLTTPQAWAAKTEDTLDAVRGAMANNTKRAFTEHWTDDEVRDPLLALVGQKCWYCETTIQRADITVDHFRPKSEVLGEPGHDGYWWLAYTIDNYRIACKHCNSGGARFDGAREGRAKGSRFPLLAGPRAWRWRDDLSLEQPLLLDPAQIGDPDLLGFDTAGYARRGHTPYSQAETQRGVCRADETIRILALNATQITEQRSDLMKEITALAQLPGHPVIQEMIDKRVHPTAQWSAAAVAALALQHACDRQVDTPPRPATARPGTTVSAPCRSSVDLHDLLEHLDPAALQAGIPLSGRHKNKVHRAVLLRDGRISVWSRPWGTPNSAARAATGSDDIDGWDFWWLTLAGVEQSLAAFRAAHTTPDPPT